jgi:hypothetical protein
VIDFDLFFEFLLEIAQEAFYRLFENKSDDSER